MKTYKAYFSISKNTDPKSFVDFIQHSGLNIQINISNSFFVEEAVGADVIFVDDETASQQCVALSDIKKKDANFLPVLLLSSENSNIEENLPGCIDDIILNPFSKNQWKTRLKAYLSLRDEEKMYGDRIRDEFEVLFVNNHSIMLLVDPENGKIEGANKAACQFYGYPHTELMQMNIKQINQLGDVEVNREMENAENDKKNYFVFEHRIADGSIKNVEVYSEKVNFHGKPLLYSIIHDITEKKQAEKSLCESEENFRQFIENAPDIIIMIDKKGIVRFVNQRIREYGNYEPEEIVGKPITDFISREDYEEAKQAVMRVFDKKQKAPFFSSSILLKDGRKIPVLTKGVLVKYKGEMVNMTIIRDISSILKTEQAVRESEKKYKEQSRLFRLMADNMPEMLWAKDIEGRYIFSNKAYCENLILVKDPDESIGKTDMFLARRQRQMHPENKGWFTFGEICMNTDTVVLENKKPQRFDEYGNVKGKFLFLDVYKAPIFDEDNQIIGTVGHGRDVTKDKEAEKALLLRDKALNSAANAIVITDANGKIEWINQAFTKLSGYTIKESFGKFTRDLLGSGKQDEAFHETLKSTLESGQVWKGEFLDKHKNGTLYEVEEVVTPVTDQNGKVEHLIGIMTDITDRKAAERELRAAKDAAEESNRLKSAFLANMNHEIRTPMNAIMGFSGLMLEALPEEMLEYAGIVNNSAGQLMHLIDDLIFLSRLQSEKLPVKEILFNPADLIKEVHLMFDLPKMKKNLELQTGLPEKAGTVAVRADADKIRQVLTNLTSNAIKYTTEGYVKLGFELHDSSILFFVEDSGMGIPKNEQQQIFDAFYRSRKAVKSAIRGTGLGLNIAKELVELMGGNIGVSSQQGKGSRFYFSLPANNIE